MASVVGIPREIKEQEGRVAPGAILVRGGRGRVRRLGVGDALALAAADVGVGRVAAHEEVDVVAAVRGDAVSGVDALKGAVARAWCAPPSEVGGVVQQFFAPKRLTNCQLLGSSVATAAPPELALA